MTTINRNPAADEKQIESFLSSINFNLPIGFIDFYRETNGAEIFTDNNYAVVWPINELLQLNRGYNVDEFAPAFFLFGSNGGGDCFVINRENGHIFDMPFICMSNEDASFRGTSFHEFVDSLNIG